MNWIKDNKMLAGILGFMIVGSIALGAYLFISYGEYSTKMEEWEQTNANVQRLKTQKIYPSAANYTDKEQQVREYAEKVDLLRVALLDPKVQEEVKPISETEFQAKLKDRVSAVKKAADSSAITLPEVFALGFEEYTGTVPRSPEIAAELSVQLDVIDKLVSTLVEAGVKSVDSLDRTKLVNETSDVQPSAPTKPQVGGANTGNKKPIITAAEAAEPVLDRYPVKLTITTDQTPFQTIINTLSDPAKMPHFLVVRQLRVENERPEAPLKEEIRSKQTAALQPFSTDSAAPAPMSTDGAGSSPASTGLTITPAAPAAPDAVTVMGEEKIKIFLEVDYIRFRKPVTADSGNSKGKP